jgi:hypothetical protein
LNIYTSRLLITWDEEQDLVLENEVQHVQSWPRYTVQTVVLFLYENKTCLITKTISGRLLSAMNLKVDRRKLITLSNIWQQACVFSSVVILQVSIY